jgi:hypothetical protein
MKLFSSIRLLLISLWLGSAVFFIGVAQVAFSALPQRELAGAVVGRSLEILNYGGITIGLLMLLSSLAGSKTTNKFSLWIERFLLLLLAAACAVGQFVIGFWIASVRGQMGRPIDELAMDDPLRVQFNTLHEYSVWVLLTTMAAAFIVFFMIANRKFVATGAAKNDIYDFSKEFKT